MKTIRCFVAGCMAFLMMGMQPARSQERYTIIPGSLGTEVCVGQWTPYRTTGFPGNCDGEVMGLEQFNTMSAGQSVDRLNQLIEVLGAIDQKMAVNVDQLTQLIEVSRASQNTMEAHNQQTNQDLRDTIARRFDTLPQELLANDSFKEELARLRADILNEVDRLYQPRPMADAP